MIIDGKIGGAASKLVYRYAPAPKHYLLFYISDPIRMQKEGGVGKPGSKYKCRFCAINGRLIN